MRASVVTAVLAVLGLLAGAVLTGPLASGPPDADRQERVVAGQARRLRRLPGTWLVVVVGLLVVNQLAVTVYLRRVHGGDPSFVARYLPSGWFDLARWDWLDALADAVPHPGLLAPSLLRVPALLELPFAVLAFLVVVRMLDAGLAGRLARGLPLVVTCALWDAVFIVAEVHLRTPWTGQDVALRLISGAATVVLVARLDAAGPDPWGRAPRAVRSAGDLLVLAASAGALSALVLVVYDVVTLYNLGRLPSALPRCLLAGAVLAAARVAARRVPRRRPGPVVDVLTSGLARAVAAFAPGALPVRYLLLLSAPWLLVVAGAALAGLAVVPTLTAVARRLPAGVTTGGWAAGLVATAAVGAAGLVAGGVGGARLNGHSEVPLLAGVVTATLAAVGAAWAADRLLLLARLRRRAAPAR